MTRYALTGAPAEAFGHPSACTEPANGEVVDDIPIHYNGTSLASKSTGSIDFPSHGHSVNKKGECVDYQTHEVSVDTASPSVSYNGSPLITVGSGVATDPGTGGDIDITGSGGNDTVTES